MHRYVLAILIVMVAAMSSGRLVARPAEQAATQNHIGWVIDVLKRMQTVTVGMTRADLLKVFTTQGGLSTRQAQSYVSQDCPYFKVSVTFKPVGPEGDGTDGRNDVILTISKPYLEFSILD